MKSIEGLLTPPANSSSSERTIQRAGSKPPVARIFLPVASCIDSDTLPRAWWPQGWFAACSVALLGLKWRKRPRAGQGLSARAAKAGERWAVCELLDRCLGKPVQPTVTAGEVEVCRIRLEVDPGPMRVSRDDP